MTTATNLRPGTIEWGGASLVLRYSGLVAPVYRGLLREIAELYVPPELRHQGRASALMAEVCRQADNESVTLLLMPNPYEERPGAHPGLTQRGLAVWYAARFGFFTLQHDPALVMIRLPGEIQPTQAMPLSPIAQAARVVAQQAARRGRLSTEGDPDATI